MIIRFRGKHGNYRINTDTTTPLASVLAEVELQLPPHGPLTLSASPAAPGEFATDMWQKAVGELGIKHGDMFFLGYEEPAASGASPTESKPANVSTAASFAKCSALDAQLSQQSGRIMRPTTALCKHGPKGMCEYCQPLEPWNEEYEVEHGIKHTSFHAWRRRLREEGKALEQPNFRVNTRCSQGHTPWPASFCSKCQPPAITLQRQKFRMVDHVEFASPKIVEHFIEFWRQTNEQRIGFLIGKYEPYEQVPLGIKAEIHAIWEPEQQDSADSVLLRELPNAVVCEASRLLGLEIVGVVFTDLVDAGAGKVLTKRHLDSYFLSSLEIVFSARLQNQFPFHLPASESLVGKTQGPLRSDTPDVRLSSRFVTCCISGNEFGDIDVACYQTSLQAEALVEADLVVPSTNPSVLRIQDPSPSRYVPDISYRRINEYKLTVTEDAKPAFPVDYLLVSLSHGFKNTGAIAAEPQGFTIENRSNLRAQTPSQLYDFLSLSQGISVDKLRDFHALLYLLALGVLQPEEHELLARLLAGEDVVLDFARGPGVNTLRMLAS